MGHHRTVSKMLVVSTQIAVWPAITRTFLRQLGRPLPESTTHAHCNVPLTPNAELDLHGSVPSRPAIPQLHKPKCQYRSRS